MTPKLTKLIAESCVRWPRPWHGANVYVFSLFSLYGRWGPLDRCRTYMADTPTISTAECRRAHSENFYYVWLFQIFSDLGNLTLHFSNSGSKNSHSVAPSWNLTHPERCASQLCAGTCQDMFFSSKRLCKDTPAIVQQTSSVAPTSALP